MRFFHRCFAVAFVCASFVGFAGCNDEGSGAGIPFKAEAEPLGGFKYDTGLIPAGSPVQVSISLSAGGKVLVEAMGEAAKDGVKGKAGTGKVGLDVHVKLDGRLKITSPLKNIDDDLPGLKDIDVPILGDATFEPFVVENGQSATVTVAIPETKLPDIPLGATPGKLQLTIAAGSTLTTVFEGGCMSVAGEKATYTGSAKTNGKLVLKGTLVIELPAPLNKSVDLGDIAVPIPAFDAALDFGVQAAKGAGDGQQGRTCAAPPREVKAEGGTSEGGGGGDAGGGGETDAGGGSGNFTVALDGVTRTPGRYFTNDDQFESKLRRNACFYFTGGGLGVESRICVAAFTAGSGCTTAGVGVQYQPDDGSFATYFSASGDANCGLSMSFVNATRFAGAFGGQVKDVNGTTHQLTATFDVGPKPL